MTSHYDALIVEVDKTLSMVREFWLSAKTDHRADEERKNMNRINDLLDQRLSLTKARDAAAALSTK